MRNIFAELADEVRVLELEVRKLELENQIVQLKAEQLTDGDCIGCAGPCMVVDVAAKLQEDIEGLEAELSTRKEDSEVLMKVVEVANRWGEDHDTIQVHRDAMYKISDLVGDYIDVPEGSPETPIDDLYTTTISVFLEMP